MGNLLESIKKYFENTPKDVLDNDWKEIEFLNEIGPDVIEYDDGWNGDNYHLVKKILKELEV